MDQRDIETARRRAEKYLLAAGIVITPAERESLEVVGLGLGKFEKFGAVISEFSSTSRNERDLFTDPEIQRFLD